MNAREFELTIPQLVVLIGALRTQSGNAGFVRKCVALADGLEFTDDEKTRHGIVVDCARETVLWKRRPDDSAPKVQRSLDADQFAFVRAVLASPELVVPASSESVFLLDLFGVP